MGRRSKKNKKRAKVTGHPEPGTLKIDRKRKSGHYVGTNHSVVYKDGKVHAYTAWNDNEEDVGTPMDFDAWEKAMRKARR